MTDFFLPQLEDCAGETSLCPQETYNAHKRYTMLMKLAAVQYRKLEIQSGCKQKLKTNWQDNLKRKGGTGNISRYHKPFCGFSSCTFSMIQCCTELHQVLHQVNQMYQGGTNIAYTGQTMKHTCLLKPKSLLRTMVWLTVPPHCSHNMQPLDRSVCGTVITNHPGQTIIIHNVAKILGKAFPLAFIPKYIYMAFMLLASVHLILMTSVRKNLSAYM